MLKLSKIKSGANNFRDENGDIVVKIEKNVSLFSNYVNL